MVKEQPDCGTSRSYCRYADPLGSVIFLSNLRSFSRVTTSAVFGIVRHRLEYVALWRRDSEGAYELARADAVEYRRRFGPDVVAPEITSGG